MRFLFSLCAILPAAVYAQKNASTSGPNQILSVSASQAQTIITSAIANATAEQIPENIAVVDNGGNLVAFLRMDGSYLGSIDISTKKARTAVLFNGLASGDLYTLVQPGAPLYGADATNGGLIVFAGGLPLMWEGKIIGGVGVSGGSVEQDLKVATAAVAALNAPS